MTYTEVQRRMDETKMKGSGIGKAVRQTLVQGLEQDRVRFGILRCVDILERDSDDVMVCILPQGKARDAAVRIQHTLIEAFCRENDVRCLKVDCATKISTVFTSAATKEQKERAAGADLSCLLIMTPSAPASKEDDFVCDYCENFMLGGVVPHGCVEIPV